MIRILNSKGAVLFEGEGPWIRVPFDELNLEDAQLEGIQAEGAFLYGAKLARANLRGADLYWSIAREADFTGANLENAQFQGAECTEAIFRDANLKGADFTKSNVGSHTEFHKADLRTPSLAEAKLEGARYSSETLFLPEFDPSVYGMVHAEPVRDTAIEKRAGETI
jgi:uncharacterized protein YjbI with pentapeptide repeats